MGSFPAVEPASAGPDQASEERVEEDVRRAGRAGSGVPGPRAEEQTRDDTDEGWGERPGGAERDDWFESERPPHH